MQNKQIFDETAYWKAAEFDGNTIVPIPVPSDQKSLVIQIYRGFSICTLA